jgi:transposase
MTPRKSKSGKIATRVAHLPIVHPDAAGIDVGSNEHWVAVPPDRDQQPVRRFGACTRDLEALADWLQRCGVQTVAMESTGIYWVPLFELLERRGFRVSLVDPRQAKRAPGRPKTDRLDCQWLQRLHACGLLAASFRPADDIVVLRGYLRQRAMLIRYAAQHVQHLQKALEQMNVKLAEVISDITGKTGLDIIRAILRGERDPRELAKYRNKHCQANEARIADALHGNWREEHLFALDQALSLYQHYHMLLEECDARIARYLGELPNKAGEQTLPPKPRLRKRSVNEPRFDARGLLFRLCGVDLTAIEGIDGTTALVVLSEVGLDLSRFPSAKHFCSWLGLCPQHQVSGGKVLGRQTRPGVNRAAKALRLAAFSLSRSQSALGAFYRRIRARAGGAQANVATAHKLARLVYALLTRGQAYRSQGLEEYEAAQRERNVKSLEKRARQLGYTLVESPPTA